MSTVKPTHVVMKAPKKTDSTDSKSALEARAARFGIVANANQATGSPKVAGSTTTTSATDKAVLEARAARFKTSTAAPSAPDPSKLAARAARFADILGSSSASATTNKTSLPASTSSSTDTDILAKRASRFADITKEPATKGNRR